MKWKQFLKPDWKKIVIIIVIYFILSFLFPVQFCFGGVSGPQQLSFPVIQFPFYFYDISHSNINYSSCTSNFIPAYLSVIYWYLLSCLIVWIYDKVKKK